MSPLGDVQDVGTLTLRGFAVTTEVLAYGCVLAVSFYLWRIRTHLPRDVFLRMWVAMAALAIARWLDPPGTNVAVFTYAKVALAIVSVASVASLVFLAKFASPRSSLPRLGELGLGLRASSSLESILDASLDAFYLLEAVRDRASEVIDMRYVAINLNAAKRLGLARDQVVGRRMLDLFPIDPVREVVTKCATALRNGTVTTYEEKVDLEGFPNGWILVNMLPFGDFVAVFTREITSEKEEAQRVRMNGERLRVLLENVKDYAIFLLDPNGRVLTWSKAAEQVMGYSEHEVLGKHHAIFYSEASGDRAHQTDLDLVSRVGRTEREGWRTRKNGERFWCHVIVTAIFNLDGSLHGFSKIVRDLSEQKAHERTVERSLREKEVLLREVHHRVKNNLQLVTSLLNLQASKVGEVSSKDAILESRDRVYAISLLYEKLYRAEEIGSIDLQEYAGQLVQSLVEAHAASVPSPEWSIQFDRVVVSVDTAVPCGLIINELATNALKHAFDGTLARPPRIEIRGDQHDGMIDLTFRDNGKGMQPVSMDRSPTLGCMLVKMLARQVNGTAEVESDNGTVWRIRFPNRAHSG